MSDGVVRRLPLLAEVDGGVRESLALAMLRHFTRAGAGASGRWAVPGPRGGQLVRASSACSIAGRCPRGDARALRGPGSAAGGAFD